MKLRIHGTALRLRLNQAEVAQFSKTGWLEEGIQFAPGASLAFSLESVSSLDSPRAVFQNSVLKIQVPRAIANDWMTTDRVGISGQQSLPGGKQLAILIEKDFKCIHSEHPDPDAYPNPLEEAGAAHHHRKME